jgi:prepilin-type N-terminal cleavage/methylation domain-containing protein
MTTAVTHRIDQGRSTVTMQHTTIPRRRVRGSAGMTLVELLIVIVIMGILAAVAVLGVSSIQSSGNSTACGQSRDSLKAAVATHYASAGVYPTTIAQLTSTTPAEFTVATGVTASGATLSGTGWTVTLGANGAVTSSGC